MALRKDFQIGQSGSSANFTGAGTNYLVQTTTGVLYRVFLDSAGRVAFRKSSDGGVSWSMNTQLSTDAPTNLAIWYDRWSDISAGLIHVAWTDGTADDTFYRTIDTESSDTLSTATTIFAGNTTAGGGMLTIARAVGGNVYCKTVIDAGAEGGFYRLANANVPNGAWDAARTDCEAKATTDQGILVPNLNNADTQDMLLIFWDASANRISRYNYDDSANSWAETEFGAPMTFTDQVATTAYPHFAAAVDLTNSQIVVVAWNGIDAANADLTCWTVTESAITAVTDVVTNSTDDQGLCGICLDTVNNIWWAYYGGKSDGSETYSTAINLYCKASTDSGTTWGPETALTSAAASIAGLYPLPRLLSQATLPPPLAYYVTLGVNQLNVNVALPQRRASVTIGI
jgi:hypothetical protein